MDTSNHSEIRFEREIDNLLESIAEEEDFCDYKIERAAGALKGDGYLGVITAVQISGKIKTGQKKTLNLMVKTSHKSDILREKAPIASVFQAEIYMYDNVIPTFRNFQTEKDLPALVNFAKCYKTCTLENKEALILENLRYSGYSLWERRIPMDEDHTKLVLVNYGRFHALSFALRDQFPELYQKLTAPMEDILDTFLKKSDFGHMFVLHSGEALESLDPVTDKHAIEKFKKLINELQSFFKDVCEIVEEYSAILHGDSWTNNMMFKYEDLDNPKKPTKVCLIDLQISRVGTPVCDLSYYFYSCTSKKIINNWEYYLDVYYDSFSQYLKELGTNPDDVYPYSVFREHWKKFARYGLLMSTFIIHVMLTEQNEATTLADVVDSGKNINEAFTYNISNTEEYNDRISHNILHFAENNLI